MQQEKLLGYEYLYVPSDNNSNITLLLLHGTGGDEYNLLEIGKLIDPNAHVLSLRGNVVEGHLNRFFERISEGIFNPDDVKKRSKDLSDFINTAKEIHNLSHTNIVAVGYSNGANIAAAILLLYPKTLSGAVLLRAMLPIEPFNKPNLTDTPILLLSGLQDTIIAELEVLKLTELFIASYAQLTHQWINTGHSITNDDIEISKTWITNNFKNI